MIPIVPGKFAATFTRKFGSMFVQSRPIGPFLLSLGPGIARRVFFPYPSLTHSLSLAFSPIVGSILVLTSIAMLRGPWSHMKHMISMERLPFTGTYVGSMVLTLWSSLIVKNNERERQGKGEGREQ